MNNSKKVLAGIATVFAGSLGSTMVFSKIFHSKPIEGVELDNLDEDSYVNYEVLFGFGELYVNKERFKAADLKCRCGGMEVYFNNATLLDGEGVIKIDSSYGGIELYIPKDWTVENNLRVGMGAVEFKNEGDPQSDKVIKLIGNVSLGAVEITYV